MPSAALCQSSAALNQRCFDSTQHGLAQHALLSGRLLGGGYRRVKAELAAVALLVDAEATDDAGDDHHRAGQEERVLVANRLSCCRANEESDDRWGQQAARGQERVSDLQYGCLLYTSDAADDIALV